MTNVVELMLLVKDGHDMYYHKDMNCFDYCPISEIERKDIIENWELYQNMKIGENRNNVRLSHDDVNHKEIMSFYVKECVEDKEIRKQLFYILRRHNFVDAFLSKLRELDLYDDFDMVCGDIYIEIFEEWKEKNHLTF